MAIDPYQQLVQRIITQLGIYTQLTDTQDPNYINPAEIWIPCRHSSWTESKRINMSGIQTEINQVVYDLINNTITSGWYLNDGEPWVDTAEVLATIDPADRTKYMIVNIMGVLYWFEPDLITLTEVIPSSSIADNSLGLNKLVQFAQWTVLYRRSTGTGNMEANTLDQLATDIGIDDIEAAITALQGLIVQNGFKILLAASSSVSGKISGLIEGTDYPTGWTLAVDSGTNLKITHTVSGRKVKNIDVFTIDGSGIERISIPFNTAYSGWYINGNDIYIEGINPIALALRVEITFNNG